ncbi:MAG: type II toxin-antitoxin system prevent-host-death family antitoxin [Pseudomonadota bacterium]
MTQIINIQEAKTHLSRLLERAHAGEEIILTKHGKPYARLMPLTPPGKRRLGFMKGHVDDAFFEPLPEDELKAWEA